MREIKFKAKRVSDGKWVEGSYLNLFNEKKGEYTHEIGYQLFEGASMDYPYPTCDTHFREIDPSTLCQFTGLVDIDRKDVYEHDIIMTEICLMVVVYIVTSASFGAIPLKQFNELKDKSNISIDSMYWFYNDIVDFGIYGNIHDK